LRDREQQLSRCFLTIADDPPYCTCPHTDLLQFIRNSLSDLTGHKKLILDQFCAKMLHNARYSRIVDYLAALADPELPKRGAKFLLKFLNDLF